MNATDTPRLFCFGLGYSARALAARLLDRGWRVAGTRRDPTSNDVTLDPRIAVHAFDRGRPLSNAAKALRETTHVLSSVPPDDIGDAVIDHHGKDLAGLTGVDWVGYLSTTGVYGDTGGATVDETAPLNPGSERSLRRVAAEQAWLALHAGHDLAVQVFRLAGIYGPGRSTLDQIRRGAARRILKPDHKFSRIHVEDIATVLEASIAHPDPGAVYNVCDNEPAAPADVVAFGCELLGIEPPPLIAFEDATPTMSRMALSFWNDRRLVNNGKLKTALGVRLAYPTYREGLEALRDAET